MSLLKLPIVECAGDARTLGNQQGEQLRERIAAFIEQRLSAFAEYSRERGGPSVERFLDAGASCLRAFEQWDPEGAAENAGIAEAAGVTPETLGSANRQCTPAQLAACSLPSSARPSQPGTAGRLHRGRAFGPSGCSPFGRVVLTRR